MIRIKELRKEKKLTQTQLGNIINLNQTAIGKYERGELEPSIKTLISLSNYFEVSLDYLLGRSDDFGNITVRAEKVGEFLSTDEKELLNVYRKMSFSDKAHVRAYAEVRLEESEEKTNKIKR